MNQPGEISASIHPQYFGRRFTVRDTRKGWNVSAQRSLSFVRVQCRALTLVRLAHTQPAPVMASIDGNLEMKSSTITDHSVEKTVIDPLKHVDFFNVRNLVTVEQLFKARVHLGHKTGVRDPYMLPYIFGTRLGVDIIDLAQTAPLMGDALNFLAHVAFRRGIILFMSRHRSTIPLVERTASDCGEYSHCAVWRGGTFTNAAVQYGAVTRLPDVIVFVSTLNSVFAQHEAILECAKMNIPTVGVVDTSCDPRLISYPIPGNDDTPCAIELYCRLFKEAIMRGKTKADELKKTCL